MPSAEIITIGTEILLGEIIDTNSAYLARQLRDLNVDVFRTTTIGDNTHRIAEVLQETMQRTQIIITTGGLGPTVDDPTREAVALALGVPTEFRPELWDQILERMQRFGRIPTENQKRQAYIPVGATPIRNPVGTAPAFIATQNENIIISLPGVPREMEYLYENAVIPFLRQKYELIGTIKARILHTAGMGESVIDEQIGDLEKLSNPTVGLAAHYGQVDIRITAKADTSDEADRLIQNIEESLRERLGSTIYGADEETLEDVIFHMLEEVGEKLTVVEVGMGGLLIQSLSKSASPAFLGGQSLPASDEKINMEALLQNEMTTRQSHYALGLILTTGDNQQKLEISLHTPQGTSVITRHYGGHPKNAPRWAVNTALDLFRNHIIENAN